MSEAYKYDDLKVEIIDGEKITMMAPPSSNHNFVKNSIFRIFANHLHGNVCVPVADNHKLVLEGNDGYVIPDFFVVCDRSKIKYDGIHGSPELAVEVLSPSTMESDRGVKKDLYQRAGIKEYWIVEPNNRYIEVYLLQDGRYILDKIYRLPSDKEPDEDKDKAVAEFTVNTFPNLTINLEDVFEYVSNWP